MKIAVVGCLHGELDIIYEKISQMEQSQNIKIDLVLVCGDFQSVRNENDLKCMSVPMKYARLGSFHQYYFGEKTAPKLTLLIGGNHEASNYLQTLPFGGWVAPNMYYLGYCSVVKFGDLRIGGISGIFKNCDARREHSESLPYNPGSLRSVYHMREAEIFKLLQISAKENSNLLDIFLSHDWPINIDKCGDPRNIQNLLRWKPFFRNEINNGTLGNPLLQPLVHHLKPKYWFAAHLHVAFHATVFHGQENGQTEPLKTEFQALDKVLPQRYFLHIEDIPSECTDPKLKYDPEWLAILVKVDHIWKGTGQPDIDIYNCSNQIQISSDDLDHISKLFNDDFVIPENFERCQPVLDRQNDSDPERKMNFLNPQTTAFCSKLGVWDPNEMFVQKEAVQLKNPDEIQLSDSDEDTPEGVKRQKTNDLFIIDTKGAL